MKKIHLFLILVLFACDSFSQDTLPFLHQDTLKITLQQAETDFLQNNLDLIAQKYSIDSAKATVITAKLYDNPEAKAIMFREAPQLNDAAIQKLAARQSLRELQHTRVKFPEENLDRIEAALATIPGNVSRP